MGELRAARRCSACGHVATAALEYHDQSGVLNEHISDAFGIMVKHYSLGQMARRNPTG